MWNLNEHYDIILKQLVDEDPLIVSVDANFGLVRKKASGVSIDPPKRKMFFIDQDMVDKKILGTIELSAKEMVIVYA